MADNLLDVVGPPTAKRPKLNSPLSGSDGTGKQENSKRQQAQNKCNWLKRSASCYKCCLKQRIGAP